MTHVLRLGLVAASAVSLALASGCAPPSELEHVEFIGCTSVVHPPRPNSAWSCILDPESPLEIWFSRPEGTVLEVTLDENVLGVTPKAVEGGFFFRLNNLDAGHLRLRARSETAVVATWELKLRPPEVSEDYVLARNLESTSADFRQFVQARLAEAPQGSAERARYLHWLGLAEMTTSRTREELGRAEEHLRQAFADFAETGYVSDQIRTGNLLYFLKFYLLNDSLAASKELERLPPALPEDAHSSYLIAYSHGAWAVNTNNPRAAWYHLDKALGYALRFRLEDEIHQVEQMRAPLLSRLGRYEEAVDLLTRLASDDPTSNEEASLVHNIAWNQLLAWEVWGGPNGARDAGFDAIAAYAPVPLLEKALKVFVAEGKSDEQISTHFNLALAYLHLGETRNAERHLQQALAQTSSPKHWHQVWSFDIRGRLALNEGRAQDALSHYELLSRLAQGHKSTDGSWRAHLGRARALTALGERSAALAAYQDAEVLVDKEILAVPVGAERETSLQARAVGTREYLDLLLTSGTEEDKARAFALARRSRSRAFRGLVESDRIAELRPEQLLEWNEIVKELQGLDRQEADDRTLSVEHQGEVVQERQRERSRLLDRSHLLLGGDLLAEQALPPLRRDETLLLYHPLPQGWVAFAANEQRLEAHRIRPPASGQPSDDESWSQLLLSPLADILKEARQVRILTHGLLSTIDFHALPFEGGVLLDKMAVIYSLDLGPTRRDAALKEPGNVLLVVDPGQNLRHAVAEGDAVERALEQVHPTGRVERLDHADATLESFLAALADADLLHFTGHADFSGRGGWDSGLHFAGKTRLTVSSLLAARSVPHTIVLPACESSASVEGPTEGLGLARAFLLAGAGEVVGAVRPVSDTDSRILIEALYRHWDGASPVAGALRKAQLALRAHGKGDDWRSFRVVER